MRIGKALEVADVRADGVRGSYVTLTRSFLAACPRGTGGRGLPLGSALPLPVRRGLPLPLGEGGGEGCLPARRPRLERAGADHPHILRQLPEKIVVTLGGPRCTWGDHDRIPSVFADVSCE